MNPTPPCAVCGNPVEMEIAQGVRFSTGPNSTVVVFEHPKIVNCPTCGAALHLAVTGIQGNQMKTVQVPQASHPLVVIPKGRVQVG
jgi:hypothetical protein